MKLTRHFFMSRDLDDLERLEEELEQAGVLTPQIHLLTLEDSEADSHQHLHQVSSLMKKDIIHSTLLGAVLGVVVAALVLVLAFSMGWTDSAPGWLPWIFLAVVALGFCTWEGGLWGIQTPNVHFKQFEDRMREGHHVFFIDLEPEQQAVVDRCVARHPTVSRAGRGEAAPRWVVLGQHRFRKIFVDTLP